jgi:hypothetical protein
LNKTRQVDVLDIFVGSHGNQIVVRMDFPGAVYVEPLREFCAKNRIVWIDGEPWSLSEAISWEFPYGYSNWERFVRWLGERIHCDSLQHFHEEEAFWVDDDGIPRDEWVARLDRIAEQTSPGRCRQILERGY